MSKPEATFRGTSEAGQHWVLEMHHDQYPESPRESQENLGTMIYGHRRYVLGDERITEGSMEEYLSNRGLSPDKIVSLPLYLYDHSGLAMSTTPFGCPWDSGCVGAILVSHDKIQQEYGDTSEETIEKVEEYLRNEVAEMHAYLAGESYSMRAYQAKGAEDSDDEDEPVNEQDIIDCSGFLGSDPRTNGMIHHLPEEAAAALAPALRAHFGRLPNEEVEAQPAPAAPKSPRPR